MAKRLKIALTGWGTGGHIFPLLSLYNYLKTKQTIDFIWFWDENGLEYSIALQNGIDFEHIPSGKIRRYFDWRNFFEPLKNFSWIVWGIYYILVRRVDIVFSKGWFVGLPACIAGYILGKRVYVHESDTVWGLANRIISKFATAILYTFPNAKIDGKKHILVGQILNPSLISQIDIEHEREENEFLEVIVLGGSQGSTILFENIKQVAPNFTGVHFSIVLGEKNLHFKKDFEKFPQITTYDFVTQEQMGILLEHADLAVTRAGATSLWETYFFWIHAIIVPLAGSAQDHQKQNARYFNKQFNSDVLEESPTLNVELFRLLNRYKEMRKQDLNLHEFMRALEMIETYVTQKV